MPVLTEELTWRLGDTGVILNTDSESFPFTDIDDAKGFDSPEFRETQRDHEGDDGGYMDAEFEKGREISLEGTIYADTGTMESYLDSLKANWAPSKVPVPLYFTAPGVSERFVWVKPLGVRYNWDKLRRTGQTAVQFRAFAEDPRIYDNNELEYTINLGATVATGRGYNKSYNFGYGGVTGSNDGVFVVVGGNRPTPPVFTIVGPVTNPRIINDNTGQTMLFNITVGAGETLVVRPQYKTVKLNDVTNRRPSLTSPTWFYLEQGSQFIRYRAESSDPTSMLVINYYNAWR